MRERNALFILCLSISLSAWSSQPLLWNQPAVEAQCPLQHQALWVKYTGGNACIRYFFAGNLTSAKNVVVVLSGDRDTFMRRNPADIPNNTLEALDKQAQKISEKIGLPVIILARPGTYGSSGDHAKRRQPEEFQALDAALTGLRERYGMHHFILSGHSGGATAAAAILTLGRKDIRCAILTSGAYGLLERAERLRIIRGEKSQRDKDINGLAHPYDPLEHISGIVADPKRHILIIGNSHDRVTPFDLQAKFAAALRTHGHWVSLIEWPAVPPQFHQLKFSPLRQNLQQCEL